MLMEFLYAVGCYVVGFILVALLYHKIEESDDPPFLKVMVAFVWGASPIMLPVIVLIGSIISFGWGMLELAKYVNKKIGKISIKFQD